MHYLNRFLFVALVSLLHVQAFSQVTTGGTSAPTSCDGWAYINNAASMTSWNWSDSTGNPIGSSADSLYNLCQGNYTLDYVDGTGSHTYTFYIGTSPCAGFTSTVSVVGTALNDCTGSVTISISGGSGPFSYTWYTSSGNFILTAPTLDSMCAGPFTIVVSDMNGCTTSVSGTVTDACSGLSSYLSGSDNSDSVTCNGTLSVMAYNGTSPYVYTWNNGATTNALTGLCAGYYSVTITDANGCTDTSGYTISDSIPGVCSFPVYLSATPSTNPMFCNGNIYPAPYGTAPYTYLWSNGSTTADQLNICTGYYTVTITDANGCTGSASVYVNDSLNNGYGMSGYVWTSDESAAGLCDGTAEVIVNGGVPPYQYLQSNGIDSIYLANLCSGVYSVIVVDAQGDSLMLDYLISTPGNTIINIPYPDSTIVDSLFSTLISNCSIDYNTIDSAYIDAFTVLSGDSVLITWVIYSSAGVEYIDAPYYVGTNGNGIYTFTLSVFCPQKSTGQYLKVLDQLYLGDGSLGLEAPGLENTVVYPNPFSASFHIQFGQAGDYTIALYDLTGRQILEQQVRNVSSAEIDQLGILSKGEYILHITGNNGTLLQKLMK